MTLGIPSSSSRPRSRGVGIDGAWVGREASFSPVRTGRLEIAQCLSTESAGEWPQSRRDDRTQPALFRPDGTLLHEDVLPSAYVLGYFRGVPPGLRNRSSELGVGPLDIRRRSSEVPIEPLDIPRPISEVRIASPDIRPRVLEVQARPPDIPRPVSEVQDAPLDIPRLIWKLQDGPLLIFDHPLSCQNVRIQ